MAMGRTIVGASKLRSDADHEWLITNGLGGYASGPVVGPATRRYHGHLVAALPPPLGRTMTLSHLSEQVILPDGTKRTLDAAHLNEFRLDDGLPLWSFDLGKGFTLEKQILLVHRQNTVHIAYRLRSGTGRVSLQLQPAIAFRSHHGPLRPPARQHYRVETSGSGYELHAEGTPLPRLRLLWLDAPHTFTPDGQGFIEAHYPVEAERGYDAEGELWVPGRFHVELDLGHCGTLIASTEPWEQLRALTPAAVLGSELERRQELLRRTHPAARDGFGAELTLAADQFLITQGTHHGRTIIAGYHWFTDWGRDTMISLEGLTLTTGRYDEAREILRTFARHMKDGLIPNLFPEGEAEGLYNTADATLWFFHALDRYVDITDDRDTLRELLPTLRHIIDAHLRGTRFGIGVDPRDGLLRQGEEGLQLTWMDAKVDGWVVTPRRGKAVELNALWYNALRLMESWLREAGEDASALAAHAEQTQRSFNQRFWFAEGSYLYDVVDTEGPDDASCRPNQLFALSLKHPVLERARWEPVLRVVRDRLLTPVGLRSLAPGHPDYKPRYEGNVRSRDAAYHQGTVWSWLIGPTVDAWLRVYPRDRAGARALLRGFEEHLSDAGVGSISEVFDAEPPHIARGCIAQAWGVAEVLRAWVKTA